MTLTLSFILFVIGLGLILWQFANCVAAFFIVGQGYSVRISIMPGIIGGALLFISYAPLVAALL